MFANAKKKQLVNPVRESSGLVSRPKSAESFRGSSNGFLASNRLYYCGVKNKAIREQEYAQIEKLKEVSNTEGLTFKPQINPISELLALSRPANNQPAHERLLASGKATAKKKELFREMHTQIEAAQCKFKPAIDPM